MADFVKQNKYNGWGVPKNLQKLAYYRENIQVFWKFTPKNVASIALLVGVIPTAWVLLSQSQQDQKYVVNRAPTKYN
ncbi:hypothetical protein CYY_001063 [Polysphondylium violaceum]|uniref:Uncharacterized protein n=1 Tax=Polysphondylium violaceum TaxID=133409 RepID=A0A8J4Q1M3_9MYCE|nr:hypothetical protein CYY_001063 [Polysphondylium violaceum]